jgi:gluconate kinase
MPERMLPGTTACRWMHTEGVRFSKPFFDESISECRLLPLNRKLCSVVTELSFLPEAAAQLEAVEPAAFIFHISRCGSTLFTQLLGLDEENLVLPEVPFIDQLLRLGEGISEEQRTAYLKAAIRLVGQRRFPNEKRLIVKLDSWHLFFADTLRRAFPGVPFILLYRSPEAVLNSHARRRGTQMIPGMVGPALFGLPPSEEYAHQLDRYAALTVEKYLGKMLQLVQSDPKTMLACYDAGIFEELLRACAFAGIPVSSDLEEKMRQRQRFHSKEPGMVFSGDVNTGLKNVDLAPLEELFAALEKIRLSGR